jgi:voltage-gated potassium channel
VDLAPLFSIRTGGAVIIVGVPLSPAEEWADRRFGSRALRPRNAAALIAVLWVVAIVVFGIVERIIDPETFPNVWIAFWWALQTVTTVGYGDVVPGRTDGKVIASFLMIGGLSFLSIITATVTSAFITRRQTELQEMGEDPVIQRLDRIASRLDEMDAEISRLGGEAPPPL